MRRQDWRFTYAAVEVLNAAKAKETHHQSRLDWWAKKRDEIKADIKEKGIVIDESVTQLDAFYTASAANTVFRQPKVSLDSKLVDDLNECLGKVAEHSQKVKDYNTWIQVLETQQHVNLELDHTDWIHFFGK